MAKSRWPEPTAKEREAIEETALTAVLPDGATDIRATVVGTPGETLPAPLDKYPSGKGGKTEYGVVWVIRGREESAPIALYENPRCAKLLYGLLAGEEGELWQRRERRRALAKALDEKEAQEEADAKAALKAQNDGDGSPRPKRSRRTTSATTAKGSTSPRSARASRSRSSLPPSNSSAKSPASSTGSRGRTTSRGSAEAA